jgi:hypothetical protein
MGFGIALGMLLFSAVLLGIVVFAIGFANGQITWPFADPAQKFEGTGPADSVPLRLEGSVAVEWTASPANPVACRFGASLLAQGDPMFAERIASTLVDRTESSGVPRALVLVRRSDYYLHVESDCSWAVRLISRSSVQSP